jgi:hypothetical protein
MKNAHKSLIADPVGALWRAAFGVSLVESILSGQRIAITPFVEMGQDTPSGP